MCKNTFKIQSTSEYIHVNFVEYNFIIVTEKCQLKKHLWTVAFK